MPLRLGGCALALTAAVSLVVGCSDRNHQTLVGRPPPSSAGAPTTSGGPTAPSSASPTSKAPTEPTRSPTPTSSDQPVPKVKRSAGPPSPTVSAKPVRVGGTVRYSDGLSLKVVSVDFAEETKRARAASPDGPMRC